MNDKKRSVLAKAIGLLRDADALIDKVSCEESDALDNIPESLQSSTLYEGIENAVEHLEEASEQINNAIDSISEACA